MPNPADQLPPDATTLARKIAKLERDVRELRASRRLTHSAIDDGALVVRDAVGSLRAIVGQQADGTSGVNVVNGPPPPTPTTPTVNAALAALTVAWDGRFSNAEAAPLDWMRCEVHVGALPEFEPDQSTLRDTIETPQGGSVVVPLPYTEWYVKLRSRTSSGVIGPATATVAGTPRKADSADIVAGAITANAIAVGALDGKTITGSTVQTAASGTRVVLDSKVKLYNAAGDLLAEATPSGGYTSDPGFICYNTTGLGRYYAMLSRGFLLLAKEGASYARVPTIDHNIAGGNVAELRMYSGAIGTTSGVQAILDMAGSPNNGTTPARVDIFSDAGNARCDVNVTGVLSASSIATGTTTITPSAANTPTSFSVTGLTVMGSTLRGYATANSTVPGSRINAVPSAQGVTGVSVSSVTSSSLLVWVNRENTTSTVVNWMVIGS